LISINSKRAAQWKNDVWLLAMLTQMKKKGHTKTLGGTAIAGMVLFAMFGEAMAQPVDAGYQIAKTWCSGCHEIGRESGKPANDAVPSFSSIARLKSTSRTSIEVFLSTPHPKMPDYTLTRDEIRAVSAYILSLKPASS
jgi:mono/diheme cytochrome c family protein